MIQPVWQPYQSYFFPQTAQSPRGLGFPKAQVSVGQKIADVAKQWFNVSSRYGPDGGNLACAFMVNEVLYQAIGRRYGQDPTTVNSVRTDILRSGGQIISPERARPGDIAMVFNQDSLNGVEGGTAHIGIVISPNQILANSSGTKRFNGLYDFQAFSELYSPYFEILRLPEALNQPAFNYII